MQTFPLPFNEPDRLKAAQALSNIAPDTHPVLNEIVALVRASLNVPTALVSIVDENQQWFAARESFAVSETPKDYSICAHAIMDSETLVICDTHEDPRFRNHPVVVNDPHIRHYVGAPIILSNGLRVGSLCAIDYVPRPQPDPAALATLSGLARITARTLETATEIAPAATEPPAADSPDRAKANFIALIGHELRTPLTVTKGSLQLLDHAGTPEMRQRLTRAAQRSTEHFQRVVETLIDFADASTGELKLNESICDLGALVDGVAGLTLPARDGSARRLSRAGQSRAIIANVDATQIRLGLRNLALNAAQHGGSDICIGCGFDAAGDIELWVEDSNADCACNFEALTAPFAVGGDIERRETAGGLGLGLPLTTKLAEMHAGTVEITARDGKTRACIRLPGWRAELAAGAAAPSLAEAETRRRAP